MSRRDRSTPRLKRSIRPFDPHRLIGMPSPMARAMVPVNPGADEQNLGTFVRLTARSHPSKTLKTFGLVAAEWSRGDVS
jgi:hypothetical protein